MEDIIQALLDVVRIQHSEADGTEVEPFNMNDIIDMAMNIIGRPDEAEEEQELVKTIEKTVETLAPDIFPPKTFDQLDDEEQIASAASMIERSLFNTHTGNEDSADSAEDVDIQAQIDAYNRTASQGDDEEDDFDPKQAADLNNIIYSNFMQMMGLNDPKVEYPFDRSQVRYGKEKTVTEQLEEEKARQQGQEDPERPLSAIELAQKAQEQEQSDQPLSAWELAQKVIDKDIEIHTKEEYIPKALEMPETKSASQMAAEAIAKAKEVDNEKLEIEKRAEAMMEEAKRLGKDPMAFALHQQEILQYMEKNSDELVSFEDYEDLSPEEKLEIERAMEEEKRREAEARKQEDSQAAEDGPADTVQVSADAIQAPADQEGEAPSADDAAASSPVLTDEMIRQLSQEVIRENSEMILAEDGEQDLESLNEAIMENIRKMMMSGAGAPVEQESVDSLLQQVVERNTGQAPENEPEPAKESDELDELDELNEIEIPDEEPAPAEEDAVQKEEPEVPEATQAAKEEEAEENAPQETVETVPMSAAELAKAAQAAAGIKRQEEDTRETISAADLAKAVQEETRKLRQAQGLETGEIVLTEDDLDFDNIELDELTEQANEPESPAGEQEAQAAEPSPEAADELAGADIPVFVLGEHTQEEVDEALRNLETLGLEGEVYERAERLLLLELAGSEAELDAWLATRDEQAAPADVSPLYDDRDQELPDFDEMDEEIDRAFDEDFEETEEEPSGEAAAEEAEEDQGDHEEAIEAEETEDISEEVIIEEEILPEEETVQVEKTQEDIPVGTKTHGKASRKKKSVVRKKDRAGKTGASASEDAQGHTNEAGETADSDHKKEYQVSVRSPFILKNSASFMDQFEEFIVDTQENRRLSTGFKKLDAMLRYGLHKGSYFIDSDPMYLKNAFMQQIADRAAESGIDVLFLSTELSRYDLMVDTVSRLSYEIHGYDISKAVCSMDIMTGQEGANIRDLKDELNWYRGRISEHLFIMDQEAVQELVESMDEVSAGDILEEMIRSVVRDGAHKPVVVIDNIENIIPVESSEDLEPLLTGIRKLAAELGIPIIMSCGYAQVENDEEIDALEKEYRESVGNMCDVYLELDYADMITEDNEELTREDIREMIEDGDTLLIDIHVKRNRRTMRASCQIQVTPKYNYFAE